MWEVRYPVRDGGVNSHLRKQFRKTGTHGERKAGRTDVKLEKLPGAGNSHLAPFACMSFKETPLLP